MESETKTPETEETDALVPEVLPPETKPVRSPSRSLNVQPDAEEVTKSLLEVAGYDEEKRAKILAETIETQREALNADTVKSHFDGGGWVESEPRIDHRTRLQAARDLQDVVGDGGTGRESRASASPRVVVVIAEFARPKEDTRT